MTAAELEQLAKRATSAETKLELELAVSCLLEAAKQLLVQSAHRGAELVARRRDSELLNQLQGDLTTALERSFHPTVQALGPENSKPPPASPLRLVRTGSCPSCGAKIGGAVKSLTREVLQRAQLVPTKHRFDVLAVAAEDVQATVVGRDELLRAAELLVDELQTLMAHGLTAVPSIGAVERLTKAIAVARP